MGAVQRRQYYQVVFAIQCSAAIAVKKGTSSSSQDVEGMEQNRQRNASQVFCCFSTLLFILVDHIREKSK